MITILAFSFTRLPALGSLLYSDTIGSFNTFLGNVAEGKLIVGVSKVTALTGAVSAGEFTLFAVSDHRVLGVALTGESEGFSIFDGSRKTAYFLKCVARPNLIFKTILKKGTLSTEVEFKETFFPPPFTSRRIAFSSDSR